MDNLTHSLTGVLAGRVFPGDPADDSTVTRNGKPKTGRAFFWLMLVSVNLPDLDVIANLFTDPLNALHYHRGFTHSFLMAPFIALLPAIVVRLITGRGRMSWLWFCATIGVVLHIFVDLITPYGTQIFFPLSGARYSLDWMFIIDPWFTGVLTLLLVVGKIASRYRRALGFVALAFAGIYIGAESRMHSQALDMFADQLRRSGTNATSVAALPQPLGITDWMGLAMTDAGPVRQYFRLFDGGPANVPDLFPLPLDRQTKMAFGTQVVSRYLAFARFPAVTSTDEGKIHAVEFRDLQFSIPPRILLMVGLEAGERDVPFLLRLEYDPSDSLVSVTFNGRPVHPG